MLFLFILIGNSGENEDMNLITTSFRIIPFSFAPIQFDFHLSFFSFLFKHCSLSKSQPRNKDPQKPYHSDKFDFGGFRDSLHICNIDIFASQRTTIGHWFCPGVLEARLQGLWSRWRNGNPLTMLQCSFQNCFEQVVFCTFVFPYWAERFDRHHRFAPVFVST